LDRFHGTRREIGIGCTGCEEQNTEKGSKPGHAHGDYFSLLRIRGLKSDLVNQDSKTTTSLLTDGFGNVYKRGNPEARKGVEWNRTKQQTGHNRNFTNFKTSLKKKNNPIEGAFNSKYHGKSMRKTTGGKSSGGFNLL
jgi:hypothetical protein